MDYKKIIIALIAMPGYFYAATGRMMPIHSFARFAAMAENLEEQRQAVESFRCWRAAQGEAGVNSLDQDGMRPFDCAIDALHDCQQLPNPERESLLKQLLLVLAPSCQTDDEKYGRKVAQLISHKDQTCKRKGAEAFFQAKGEKLAAIREQFLSLNGSYLEPYLMEKDSLAEVIKQNVADKVDRTDYEKQYAYRLLKYLLSPAYHKSNEISHGMLNNLLFHAVKYERSQPSFVPMLLAKGAYPYASIKMRRNNVTSPMRTIFERLATKSALTLASVCLTDMLESAYVDPELLRMADRLHKNFYFWKDIASEAMDEMKRLTALRFGNEFEDDHLCASIKDLADVHRENEAFRKKLGRLGSTFRLEDYEKNWIEWLKVCNFLGADIKTLRKSAFALLKAEIKDKSDFDTIKMLQSDELDGFHKFAMACIVNEFLHCLASSLHGAVVYDLEAYTRNGEVIKTSEKDRKKHCINAERFRNRLSIKAHNLVVRLITSSENRDFEPQTESSSSQASSSSSSVE